ncbi:transcriptional regulator BetI [Pseudomonas sp. SZMC_28357]|uniref:transcriptional regulator BetI n=1 Tax=Pseudomonas sp. SZMC_28357 TaxID=3074380 RepID=UPI002870F95A|nr:transcriptional regulator BetI [Pseudomonas sp. SZMC_28357]MDR9749915.1 transcriptional regulator BetI [Pseudomonas sp. SZMC_28357]
MSETLPAEKKRRTRIEPEARRRSIIEATMHCITRHGHSGTTIERICEQAGISIGLIGHHFSSKEELMLCTYQALTDQLRAETEQHLTRKNASARDRLTAMIKSSFKGSIFNAFTLTTWLGFWGAAVSSPELKKLNHTLYFDYRAELEKCFEQAAEEQGKRIDSRSAALTLTALIDGFWLEWTLDHKAFSAAKAQACCQLVATLLLANETS